jgi:1,4-dihydroxy-2-naphthoate octaprenyltransferase
LFAAIAPVVLGSALAAHQHSFQPIPALLCAAFALLAQIGANFANDYFDHRRGADAPGRLGPTRAVAAGLISPGAMLGAAFLAAGSGLILDGGWTMILIGASSLLAALAYTGGPFPLAYHGLGEVCVLVFFGLVAVIGTYIVQAGWPAPPATWLGAAGCGLLAVNILLVNNIRDRESDERAGKRTLVVRMGRRFANRLFFGNVIFSLLVPVIFFLMQTGPAVLMPLVLAPLGLLLAKIVAATPDGDGPRFNRLLGHAAQFLALWAALLAVGLLF